MREQSIVDLDTLVRRCGVADEVRHSLDYPIGVVSRSEPDPQGGSTYELTTEGTKVFRRWLEDQGIVYVNVSGKPPEVREIPLEQIKP